MKRIARVRVKSKDSKVLQFIYDRIKDSVNEGEIYSDNFLIRIDEDKKEYDFLMNEIQSKKLKYNWMEARKYTKKEMNSYDFYILNMIYPYQHSPKDAVDFGTKYDDNSGCPKCGRGKIQTSELIIDLNKMKKYQLATMAPEIFVRSDIKEVLEENNVTGIRFGEVKDYKERETLIFNQLFIDNILPPMSDKVIIEYEDISKCKLCGFGGIYPRSELIYPKEKQSDFKDFNITYEYLWGYSLRAVIVSAKVRKILKEVKCRVGYEPIAFD